MAEQIRVDITSTDDASKTLDEVADKAAALEKLKPEVEVAADTDAAQSDIDAVDTLVAALDARAASIDVAADTGSADADLKTIADQAGDLEKLTPEIEVTADTGTADGDLKDLADTADALTAADREIVLRAKVDAAKADLKKLQDQLSATREAAKRAEGGLEGLDQVDLSSATRQAEKLDRAVTDAGDSSDQSRSVMANFAGNVASELPGVTGAFGPLNMAIGQFAEYASEGNINFAKFLKTAGGMAVVTGAVMALNHELEEVKKGKAFDQAQVDAFVESIKAGEDQVAALAARLREAGKVEFDIFGEGDPMDVTDQLVQAGINVDQFSQLVIKGKPAIDAWAKAQRDAGTDTEAIAAVVGAATEQAENYAKGVDAAKVSSKFFGQEVDKAAQNLDRSRASYEKTAAAAKAYATEQDTVNRTLAEFDTGEVASDAFTKAWDAATDDVLGMEQATADLIETNHEFIKGLRQGRRALGATGDEMDATTKVGRKNLDNVESLRQAYGRDLAAALDRSGGKFNTVRDRAGGYRRELREQLSQLGLNKTEIDKYIEALGLTPEQVNTAIKLSGQETAMRQIDALNLNLDDLPNEVASNVRMNILKGDYIGARNEIQNYYNNNPIRIEYYYQVTHPSNPNPGGALGRGVGTTMAAPAAGDVTNVTVHLPRGYRETDVVAASRRAARRSGGLYRRNHR